MILGNYLKGLNKEKKHFLFRLSTYVLGLLFFYAPFALFVRLVKFFAGAPGANDVHNLCLRMPVNWLFDPSNWSRFLTNPGYLTVFVLAFSALLVGPLFCGWLCPTGGVTEYLSKLVPDRFKIDLSGKLDPAPIRYGFLVGFIITPFVSSSICCSFCNYAIFQNVVMGLTGGWQALAFWSSTTIITLLIWFVVFGLFTKGGRGWCNFGCPVGALQSFFHFLGTKVPFTYKLKYDKGKCNGCGACRKACSVWAILPQDAGISISRHTCNVCLDCTVVCKKGALSYGRGLAEENTAVSQVPATETGFIAK